MNHIHINNEDAATVAVKSSDLLGNVHCICVSTGRLHGGVQQIAVREGGLIKATSFQGIMWLKPPTKMQVEAMYPAIVAGGYNIHAY